jgi:hypothetical protein
MATISEIIDNYYPAEGDVSVPLLADISILFDREMDEDNLEENIFISGPDTDQFVGIDLELLVDPANISQGDDFLTSPSHTGIMTGTYTFTKIDMIDETLEVAVAPYRTKLTIAPTRAMSALTSYTLHMPEVKGLDGTIYEGYYTFSWTTGTGSIQALPSSGSTSVLGITGSVDTTELTVLKTTPADHGIQIKPITKDITIEFSARLDSSTVTEDKFIITAEPATDHPSAGVTYSENELVKSLTIDDNKVIIHI